VETVHEPFSRAATIEPTLALMDDARVACHVAVLERQGGEGADLLPPPTVGFAGPQFVKSAEDSLHRDLLQRDVVFADPGHLLDAAGLGLYRSAYCADAAAQGPTQIG
jgi:hypothetical protein